jgi:dienelactone hydrolase
MSPREWFDHHVYGPPPQPGDVQIDDELVRVRGPGGELAIELLVRLPEQRPCPCFVALNFKGNRATLPGGEAERRWPYNLINRRGWGVITAGCTNGDGPPVFRDQVAKVLAIPADFGTIAAWAWALSRLTDFAIGHPGVDRSRVVALGHSRMGKAALLAGSRDDRLAGAVSNQSGCGGAALFKDKTGERIADILKFGHWFTPAFDAWADRDDELPFDQDALVRSIGGKVVVLSAEDDAWADPDAERRCARAAGASYARRPGGHDLTADDWMTAIDLLEG